MLTSRVPSNQSGSVCPEKADFPSKGGSPARLPRSWWAALRRAPASDRKAHVPALVYRRLHHVRWREQAVGADGSRRIVPASEKNYESGKGKRESETDKTCPGRARIDEGSPPPYLVRSSFDKRVVLDKGPALAGSVLRLVGVVGVFLALDIFFCRRPSLPTPLF